MIAGSFPRSAPLSHEAKPSLGRPGSRPAGSVLEVGGVERVAVSPLTLFVARRKPLLALSRRPMGPGFRMDLTLGRALNSVVADSGGGVQRLRDLVCGER